MIIPIFETPDRRLFVGAPSPDPNLLRLAIDAGFIVSSDVVKVEHSLSLFKKMSHLRTRVIRWRLGVRMAVC